MPDTFTTFDDDEIPTSFSPKDADYHQLIPESLEWLIIIQRVLKRATDERPLDPGDVFIRPKTPYAIFHLRKARFPAEVIGEALGADPASVAKAKHITLHPLDTAKDLPKTTVDYWGMG